MADTKPQYRLIGHNYSLPDLVAKVTGAAIGDDYLRRTPATPSMIMASLDAGKRVDPGLVTHV